VVERWLEVGEKAATGGIGRSLNEWCRVLTGSGLGGSGLGLRLTHSRTPHAPVSSMVDWGLQSVAGEEE